MTLLFLPFSSSRRARSKRERKSARRWGSLPYSMILRVAFWICVAACVAEQTTGLTKLPRDLTERYFNAPEFRHHRRDADTAREKDKLMQRTDFHELADCSAATCKMGKCVANACVCYHNPTDGFWGGTNCDGCSPGWAGSTCTVECAGGSCNSCNGHGVCNDGKTGDGTCTCLQSDTKGYWTGTECQRCSPSYFGSSCAQRCPGKADGTLVCFGHGTCSEDFGGDGQCVCDEGYGSASACENCDDSHHDADCRQVCLGTIGGKPCSGHGRCFNGTTGNGTCVCDEGFGTSDCSVECPSLNGALCNGHGTCRDGTANDATCVCETAWASVDCSECKRTHTGPNCELVCPLFDRKICSDHGRCTFINDSMTIFPTCQCSTGYYGSSCELACPGDPPCSGHGECVESNGTHACSCYQDSVQGYWEGTSCDHCSVSHNQSTGCLKLCPTTTRGVCNGYGICAEGRCYCHRDTADDLYNHCGDNCEFSSIPNFRDPGGGCLECTCVYCTDHAYYGVSCNRRCPGYVVQNDSSIVACSGHGSCDEGITATGLCLCDYGYGGLDCSILCPQNPETMVPCSGQHRGFCNTTQAGTFCTCGAAFAGIACELNCPTVSGQVCAGHGACWNGRLGNGTCKCDVGWAGSACNVECACDSAHGECDPVACANLTVFDKCQTCKCYGNFTGLCNECKNGTQGTSCDGPCVHGRTVVKACVCEDYYSTASCTVPCPGLLSGAICSGHGNCTFGATKMGLCVCAVGFYNTSCNTDCDITSCRQNHNMSHPQCNPTDGLCVCQDSTSGHWAGDHCDVCESGYWGSACTETCQCFGSWHLRHEHRRVLLLCRHQSRVLLGDPLRRLRFGIHRYKLREPQYRVDTVHKNRF